ncbi:phosphatase 2C-like domain-containing protein [Lipomyces oligophaga]|uniref:phosphatase 2C-like domain-containing protein n=1 Tax=Lipomyces oligophaga TaxID=45792 RepID=UPI0034CD4CB2
MNATISRVNRVGAGGSALRPRGLFFSFRLHLPASSRLFSSYYVAPAVNVQHPHPPDSSTSVPGAEQQPRLRIQLQHSPSYLGHFSSRVTRPSNEDRYALGVITVPAGSSLTPRAQKHSPAVSVRQAFFYSIFDGHGGPECADFLSQNLPEYIEQCNPNSWDELERDWRENVGGYWARWRGHHEKYSRMLSSQSDLAVRLPMAFLQADYDYTIANKKAGSTCTAVMIYSTSPNPIPYFAGGQARLTIAHVGDTRCILCDANGLAHPLTSAHHLSSTIESDRLRRYASSFFVDSFGEERFGNVENTRAFGDISMKRLGVSAEPDITEYILGGKANPAIDPDAGRSPTFGGNEPFLVLVTDGVSNYVSDQEVVDLVTSTGYRSGYARGTPQDAASEIVKFAEAVGGNDNATCLVIRLSGWAKWMAKPTDRTGDLREYRLREAFENPRGR